MGNENQTNQVEIVGPKVSKVSMESERLIKLRHGIGKNAAYRDWMLKHLGKGNRLPRGKFFNGKKAGNQKIIIIDAGLASKGVLSDQAIQLLQA